MRHEDFFTGEAVDTAASPIVSEDYATQSANFGQYIYSPQQSVISPGGYQQQPQSYFYNPSMTPAFGAPVQQPGGNPVFGLGMVPPQQPIMNQPYIPQGDVTYHIDGLNFGGNDYLPPLDYEDRIEEIKYRQFMDSVNQDAIQTVDTLSRGQQLQPVVQQYNYFGQPVYSTPYNYNFYNAEYQNELEEMREHAREKRIDLNIRLSQLAHNASGEEYNQDVINEIYRGKDVTIEGYSYQDVYNDMRFMFIQEFDNSEQYRQAFKQASDEYNKVIPKDADLDTTFENMGILWCDYALEEEKHRRRSRVREQYDSDGYKYLIKQTKMKRYAGDKGINVPELNFGAPDSSRDIIADKFAELKNGLLNSGAFPTLQHSAKLADDGSLHINYTYDNVMGSVEEAKRAQFTGFLNSITETMGGAASG